MSSELEEVVKQLTLDDLVQDLLIRALITAHPSPAAVKAAFQVLLSAHTTELSERGFQTGQPPELNRSLQSDLAGKAERWLAYFPKA